MKSSWAWLFVAVLLGGCSSWNPMSVRSQSPDESASKAEPARLVGDLAVPYGMFPLQVEAVGLVVGLQGTGSDPAPSPQRAALLDEMQTRGVKNPNQVLASTNSAMVMVRGVLRPGIQKGDHFDVEVRIESRSDTTSLRGGNLLETRLKQMAVLDNQFHEGHLLALAKGPVMVDPGAKGKDARVVLGRGMVLGGGVAMKSRSLGLVLKPGHQNVTNSSRVANAVNKRFHVFNKGVKAGVANAKTDEFIELAVHPQYKTNTDRYVRVVRTVVLRESETERMQRIVLLKQQLLDPATAAEAALELEGIGTAGVEPLLEALKTSNPELRFYAAEALAYLDRREAAAPLGETVRQQPAFRVFALTALSVMNDYAAYEQLRDLLSAPSAETRYGAFRALWTMNPGDALVLGEELGGQFSYHVLNTTGPAMIHVTSSRRPELVLFGQHQRLLTPLAVNAGNRIMVTGNRPDEITISKFTPNQPDQKRTVSNDVNDVIRAVVELGGTYPDVVQALQEAKAAGTLESRFEVDALPEAGRSYDREPAEEDNELAESESASPKKGFFARMLPPWGNKTTHDSDITEDEVEKITSAGTDSE